MADRDSTPSAPDEITPAIADAMTTDIIHYIEDTLLPKYGLTDSAGNLVDAMEGIYRAWCGKEQKRGTKRSSKKDQSLDLGLPRRVKPKTFSAEISPDDSLRARGMGIRLD